MVLAPLPEVLAAQLPKGEDRGVLVDSVDDDPAGGLPGLGALKRFDVVTHAGSAAVSSPEDLVEALRSAPPGGEGIHLRVLRKGVTRILRAAAEGPK
jgi:S1-C subfamily serine protease